MNIDWIIPCRFAEVHDNLATIVGGGIDTWWLPELPAPMQVWTVVRLLGTKDEFGDVEHSLKSRIQNPDGGHVSGLEGTFQVGASPEHLREDWLNQMTMAMVVAFEAPAEGTYSLWFSVDDAEKQVPLHVIHGLPPGMAPPD